MRPTFAHIPPAPTDVRPFVAWRAAIADTKHVGAQTDAEAVAGPWTLSDTQGWADRARAEANPPAPMTAPAQGDTDAFVRAMLRASYAASAGALGRRGRKSQATSRNLLGGPRRRGLFQAARAPRAPGPGTMTPDFPRIRRLPPYVFEEVNRLKARLRGRGRRHHRLRHGQPRHADPQAHRRQADRDRARPQDRPLLGLQGHSRPAPRHGRLLRPPLRREAGPRHRGDRHAGLEGGLRQPGPGRHRRRAT